jgi:group I intron endonuclease
MSMAYVYRHIRLDKNEPFYIGIGRDKYYKRAKQKTGRNPIWKAIAAKTEIVVEIMIDEVDIPTAKAKEIEFIKLYGRLNCGAGTLANISGGGEGMYDPPATYRKKLSERLRGEKNFFYGRKHTTEARKKMSERQLGIKKGSLSEETKRRISERHKGKPTWIKGKKNPKFSLAISGAGHHTFKGRVYCFDTTGSLINEYESISAAAKAFNASTNSIRRSITGERSCYRGFRFSYNDTPLSECKNTSKQPVRVKDTATYLEKGKIKQH